MGWGLERGLTKVNAMVAGMQQLHVRGSLVESECQKLLGDDLKRISSRKGCGVVEGG